MSKELKKLPETELEVMLVIWRADKPIHTGEIATELAEKQWKIQTVQIFLGRLVDKKFLCCEKIGRLNYYSPLIKESDYIRQETDSFIQKMYRNSPSKLIAALIENKSISEQEISELKKILDQDGD